MLQFNPPIFKTYKMLCCKFFATGYTDIRFARCEIAAVCVGGLTLRVPVGYIISPTCLKLGTLKNGIRRCVTKQFNPYTKQEQGKNNHLGATLSQKGHKKHSRIPFAADQLDNIINLTLDYRACYAVGRRFACAGSHCFATNPSGVGRISIALPD